MAFSYALRMSAAAALAAVLAAGAAAEADAQQRVRWKMHSVYGSQLAILGTGGKAVEREVEKVSNGTFQLKFFEPGALLPGGQYMDAVSQGSVESAWGAAGFNVGKVPALALFTSVPFGPAAGEYLAWVKYGGGAELHREIYGQHNIYPIYCGIIPPEASGWFRREVKSLEDLKGMKMRFYGLGAKVMEKFGVSTQLLAPGDIYPALELGTIDATEFSMPALDEGLGFHQVARHYYFPGWHQQATLNEVLVNMDKYKELSDLHKSVLNSVCDANLLNTMVEGEAKQFGAIQRMQAKGVQVHRWSEGDLAAFRKAWDEVAQAEAEKDPVFKKAWDSYAKFRADYAVWRDYGYLN